MSDIFQDRHAKLGCMVLRLFPKGMQMILKYYVTPQGLKRKYFKKDFRFVFTKNEISLMDKLPNMDEFTIEICYKILRSENMLDEPTCKWGNIPHDTEIEIADDIQRLIKATGSIIGLKSEEVTEHYFDKLLEEIKWIVTRVDSYLEQDTLGSMFISLCRSETDVISILQDLTRVKPIEESLSNTESNEREMYSRLSIPIIETFPNILRDVIRKKMPANQLYQRCVPVLKTFYPEQQANIKELQYSNTYDSLDVTLIYQLLRQFYLIPSPSKGWGSFPDKVDIQLGDDVERIRFYRNKLAHRKDTKIETNEFNEYFNEFRSIGHRMDLNFSQTTNYEQDIVGYRTCGMDTAMQAKYENAMKEVENITLKYEKRQIKLYWGESFDRSLMNLRLLLKDAKLEGRKKIRVQIVFQNDDDVESNIKVLNSLKEDINEGLTGIEFIVATRGSVVLDVDILLEMFETDNTLLKTLGFFIEKILARITVFPTETIDILVLPVEETTQWNKQKNMGEEVFLEFDIEAQLLETDDIMVEQLKKISDAILKHSNGSGTNQNITATLLPIDLDTFAPADTPKENITTMCTEALVQAQTPVNSSLPVSVVLRQQLNIYKPTIEENQYIYSCVKIDNKFVYNHLRKKLLIIYNADGTNINQIPLSYLPELVTEVDSNTVAVSCSFDKIILIINISTNSVIRTINTDDHINAISYYDNNLYVHFENLLGIYVVDLTGKEVRTIPSPSVFVSRITVDRDRLICIDLTSIYCCSLDGQLIWRFKNNIYQDLRGVTTDNEGNVYITNDETNTIVVVSHDGKHYREILIESDRSHLQRGIHFEKKENILLVCNFDDGEAFLFDVKKNLHK